MSRHAAEESSAGLVGWGANPAAGRSRTGQTSLARTVLGNLRKLSTDRAQRPLFLFSLLTIGTAIASISYASLTGCLGTVAHSLSA